MNENEIFRPDESIDSLDADTTVKNVEIIFLVDNSGSMRNSADSAGTSRIEAVNNAFKKLVPALQKLQTQKEKSFALNISIMLFNEDPEWFVYSEPVKNFVFQEIPVSPYVTYYSRAFQELGKHLSREKLFNKKGKRGEPFIMLLTDGAPSEGDDYLSVLDGLQVNGWFDGAQRYAILIGEDVINDPAARSAVSAFVKNEKEGIIDAPDAEGILSSISGKTLIIIDGMTQRRAVGEGGIGKEIEGHGFEGWGSNPHPDPSGDPFSNFGLTDNPLDDPWKNFSGGSPFDPKLQF